MAFNDASSCDGLGLPVVPGLDYLAGETEFLINGKAPRKVRYGRGTDLLTPLRHTPPPDCAWHFLVPIDCMWETGNGFADWQNPPYDWVATETGRMEHPLHGVDDLEAVVRGFKTVGGGVTFNVGILQEGHIGAKRSPNLPSSRGASCEERI